MPCWGCRPMNVNLHCHSLVDKYFSAYDSTGITGGRPNRKLGNYIYGSYLHPAKLQQEGPQFENGKYIAERLNNGKKPNRKSIKFVDFVAHAVTV